MIGMRMGMGLAGSGQAVLGEKCLTPVIAASLDADPTGTYTTEQTIRFGGANDITCDTADATIFVKYSTDGGATWLPESGYYTWVAGV